MVDRVNEILARLVQLDPKDGSEIEAVREMLLQCARDEAVDDRIRTLCAEAILKLDDLLYVDDADPGEVIESVAELLEQAIGLDLEGETGQGTASGEALIQPAPPGERATSVGAGGTDAGPEENVEAFSAVPFMNHLPENAEIDLLQDFVTESFELIDAAEASLLALEADPDDAESVNTVFRAFHTIKGTAGFLGLTSIKELAHRAESLLSRIREGEIRYSGGYADLALRSVDMIKALVEGVEGALSGHPLEKPGGFDELYRLLEAPEKFGISEAAGPSRPTAARPAGDGRDDRSEELRGSPGSAGGGDRTETERPKEKVESAGASVQRPSSGELSVRVRTDRLDRLIDMVGELVIAHSMVAQDETVQSGKYQDLARKASQVGKIVRELQDLSMALRMVPLKPTFQKMNRLVRDLAVKAGKKVTLVTHGEDTEIDRNMVDVLRDPLVHMVRNAVDHGIEPPEERAQKGKPEEGTLLLQAYNSGGNVVVELRDDGRGLNREKIVEKAIQRGLIESAAGMSDSEVYNLIFMPGFSTADRVSEVSGRGVGMDVVKRNIEALRGRIEVESEWGKGCSFKLILPLTMAITDGMLVQVGEERYIIPTVSIVKTFRPEADQLSTVAGKGEMVLLRGELLPLYRLHRFFSIGGAVTDPCAGLLVIIASGQTKYALLVDELVGQQQVVAKSLGKAVGKVTGISGAAILGDGRVGLILDTVELASLARFDGGAGLPDRSPEPEPVAV
ncbi:MAG: chemotaxis protein CheA [Acidobacteriota bacterium]